MGLQKHYEYSVGTREQFQGKNVVSLSLIYQLLSQQWFHNSVNKGLLEANISNKILMNSKIKKKLFHLKAARILLQIDANSAKQYKKVVSRQVNWIALEIKENDELFEYPNAIIYLLNLMLSCLRRLFPQTTHLIQLEHDSDLSDFSTLKGYQVHYNSKQEFKNLTKTIILFLNKINTTVAYLNYAQKSITKKISRRVQQVNEKFHLADGVPCWDFFTQTIIANCFKLHRKSQKITNSMFNQWIGQFKSRVNLYGLQKVEQNNNEQRYGTKIFTPLIIIFPPSNDK